MNMIQILQNLFPVVLNMSLTGGIVISLVLLVRLFLRRAPKIWSYALWSVVLFRLLCPVSISAPFSLLTPVSPSSREATANTTSLSYLSTDEEQESARLTQQSPRAPGAYTAYDGNRQTLVRINQILSPATGASGADANLEISVTGASRLWMVGALAVFLYNAVSVILLRRKLIGCIRLRDNIWLADHISSPFVIGLLRPKIYLPSFLDERETGYIICHEQVHIHRLDYITRFLAFLALCIHWFNPLVWIAFVLSGRDMEMSCDEAVVRRNGDAIRADYSRSLLHLATRDLVISSMPLAFCGGETTARIHNLLSWKKYAPWFRTVAAAACVLFLAVAAVNPVHIRSGQYKSMEDFAARTMENARSITFYERSGRRSTAPIQDTRLEWLEQKASVEGLSPDGTLEAWRFNYLIRMEPDPQCVLTYFRDGSDRWYPLDKYNAGFNIVALRYDNGSYDILYNHSDIESGNFFHRYDSYEEAVHDWYVTENDLDLPLYNPSSPEETTQSHEEAEQPYDGSGWYADITLGEEEEASQIDSYFSTGKYRDPHFPVIPYRSYEFTN